MYQAVDFITNPLDDDITLCWFGIDCMVLQYSKVNNNNNTACDVIIERIRDKIHSLGMTELFLPLESLL